jgi:hypothetical protein
MTGGRSGRLHLLRKGWLFGSGMAERVVHEGEGPIAAIAWAGSLVAWANEAGVKVLDVTTEEPVSFVATPAGSPPPDVCTPRLLWESDSSLLVAWGSEVRVVSIREKRVASPAAAGGAAGTDHAEAAFTVKRFGEVSAKLTCPGVMLCGIAPFGEDLALLW